MTRTTAPPAPRSFWVSLCIGLVVMGWGVRQYLDATPDLDRRLDLAKWLVGLDLTHDLLVAPVVVGVGSVVSRIVPRSARAPAQAALIATGAVLLVGVLPLVGSAGDANPTIQPIRYGPPIAAVIGLIWATAAVATISAAVRGRHQQ
jgi:hypothetical protein